MSRPFPIARRRRAERRALALAMLAGVAAAGYAALSAVVAARRTSGLDARVRAAFPRRRRPRVKQVVTAMGVLGTPQGHGPISGALAAYLLWRGHGLRAAALAPAASAVSRALSVSLEHVEKRRRPPPGRHKPSEPSFPSGHGMETAAVALAAAYALARTGETPAAAAGASAIVLPALSGVGRLYLDRHWATDVAGGWLAGLAVGAACAAAYEWGEARD